MLLQIALIVVLCGRNEATGPDLCVLANDNGPMTEEPAEAVDGNAIPNGDPPIGASPDINCILQQAAVADMDVRGIDDLRPRADDGPFAYTALHITEFRRR